jgi:hypothetical protein
MDMTLVSGRVGPGIISQRLLCDFANIQGSSWLPCYIMHCFQGGKAWRKQSNTLTIADLSVFVVAAS